MAVAAVNIGGLSRTVAVTRVLLAVSLTALAAVVIGGWSGGEPDLGRLTPIEAGPLDILRSAGFLFFAFAGYARIATLGEEVSEPERTIPRAIPTALLAVLALYAVVGVTALAVAGPDALAGTDAPLRLLGDASGPVAAVVRIGAGIAALGVLLNLIPGISRVGLAMARNGELPGWFSHVDPKRSLPLRAELTLTAIIVAIIMMIDLRGAIALSGVAVLAYYAITNAAALTLEPAKRRWPRWVAVVGLVGCVMLIVALPPAAVAGGAAALAIGVVVRTAIGRDRI